MNPEQPQTPPEDQFPAALTPPAATWIDKLASVLFSIFCLELGLFLLIYPWMDTLWSRNWLFHLVPGWQPFLMSQQFRGAVSGLGILNLFLGFIEAVRLRRFAGRH